MIISKTDTQNFADYEVFAPGIALPWWLKLLIQKPKEIRLSGILYADDKNGLVVRQVMDDNADPVFTNGIDDIAIDNVSKLLLCVPSIKESFFRSGFVPKTTSEYIVGIRIVNNNPVVNVVTQQPEALEE